MLYRYDMRILPVTCTATASYSTVQIRSQVQCITNTLARLGSGTNVVAVTLFKWFKD